MTTKKHPRRYIGHKPQTVKRNAVQGRGHLALTKAEKKPA